MILVDERQFVLHDEKKSRYKQICELSNRIQLSFFEKYIRYFFFECINEAFDPTCHICIITFDLFTQLNVIKL